MGEILRKGLVILILPIAIIVQLIWGLFAIPTGIIYAVLLPKKPVWIWRLTWDHIFGPMQGWFYLLTGDRWEMLK